MSASLSVVIPAYNEAVRLGNTIRAVVDYMREHAPDAEVIVVDDGSSDQTAELARQTFTDASEPPHLGHQLQIKSRKRKSRQARTARRAW